jgi:excisionase family DNA binding protein
MDSSPSSVARVIPFPREGWVTKRQLAEHLQVSEKTVERWMAAGMPCLRQGRSVRFRVSDCEAWLGAAA